MKIALLRTLAAADDSHYCKLGQSSVKTLSSLNLPLSSSSTTSRELLSQFSTCSGWRWLEVREKVKENCHVFVNQFLGNIHSKTFGCWKIESVFGDVKWCFNASWGLKGLVCDRGSNLCVSEPVYLQIHITTCKLLAGVVCACIVAATLLF